MNEQMSSITKLILLEAVKEYKESQNWGEDDTNAICDAENWLYSQLLPEDKEALNDRLDQLKRESYDLKSEIDVLGDKRYELIGEIVDVRQLLEQYK